MRVGACGWVGVHWEGKGAGEGSAHRVGRGTPAQTHLSSPPSKKTQHKQVGCALASDFNRLSAACPAAFGRVRGALDLSTLWREAQLAQSEWGAGRTRGGGVHGCG